MISWGAGDRGALHLSQGTKRRRKNRNTGAGVKKRRSKIEGILYTSLLIGATTPWVQPQQSAAGEATLSTYISAGNRALFPPGLLASPPINHSRGSRRRTGENWNWL